MIADRPAPRSSASPVTSAALWFRLPGWTLALILGASLGSRPANAQRPIVASGRVVREQGKDTIPVPGVRIVIHRVGRSQQGPLDSTLSDTAGRFHFRFVPDTTVLFLLSARYAGIEYFSSPITTDPGLPDSAITVIVSDTSSNQRVNEVARYLVVRKPAEDSSRAVLDLIVLVNKGTLTRVAYDSTLPSWIGRIPRGIANARVGQADISSEAVVLRNDSILVFAPIAPGEKQISLEYLIPPGGSLSLDFPEDSVATNVLAQDRTARVEGAGLAAVDSQSIEGENFYRWVGAPRPGDVLQVTFRDPARAVPSWVLPLLVITAAGVVLFALFRLQRRPALVTIDSLTDRIAVLDARYGGREADVSPEEWQGYLRDRDQFRAQLAAHLAARGSPP
ncbi:MAG: hypothetical protein ABI613_05635 [Gemmatimonadota bacterium]